MRNNKGRPIGSNNIKPTKEETRLIVARLKSKAVNGDATAALALVHWLKSDNMRAAA